MKKLILFARKKTLCAMSLAVVMFNDAVDLSMYFFFPVIAFFVFPIAMVILAAP